MSDSVSLVPRITAGDEGTKTHPCLVPFADLPEDQQRKDALFIAIVQALAPHPEVTGS
jgi:hypothetical protein